MGKSSTEMACFVRLNILPSFMATLTFRLAHGELEMFMPLLNIIMGKSPGGMHPLNIPHFTFQNLTHPSEKFVPEPGRPVPKTPGPHR
jgi:hypothetical protein